MKNPISLWLSALAVVFGALLMGSEDYSPAEIFFPRFVAQVVDSNFGVGYAVSTADINKDGKNDIVAINPTEAVWFENPSWKRHIMIDGATRKDNVCLAVYDIDGDGRLDVALGAEWMPSNTEAGGTLQWLRQPQSLSEPWRVFPIGAEPTLHRIRWADCNNDGRKELIVAPLQGRGTKPPNWANGNGVRLMAFHIPANPLGDAWKVEVIDSSLHSLHNFVAVNFDMDPAEEILTASLEGIFLFDRNTSGQWTKRQIGQGNDEEAGVPGAGEIRLGQFRSGKRYIATIEPWHGDQLVVYLPPVDEGELWTRKVLNAKLKQGHALWCADVDGDGDEELVVGWREAREGQNYGVAVYDPVDENWNMGRKYLVDDGGMACEDLTVADLNGDGFPEIVASGRASHNLKIYWNQGKEK